MKGDFIISTRAEFLGSWVNYHRKVGVMIRKTLDGNSAHVNAVEHGDGLTSLQFRRSAGAQTEEIKAKLTKANIIRAGKTREPVYHAGRCLWGALCNRYGE